MIQMLGLRGPNKTLPGICNSHFLIRNRRSDPAYTLHWCTNPLFQKPQKDIIIIMIRILQLPYLSSPFRKRGEKVPPLPRFTVGT
jgi:hypothetical protein